MKLLNPVHPLKNKLRELKVPQHAAAFSLGISYTQFCKYLCGACRMPVRVEEKLQRLIEQLTKEKAT